MCGFGIEIYKDICFGGFRFDVWMFCVMCCFYLIGFEFFFIDGDRVVGLLCLIMVEVF